MKKLVIALITLVGFLASAEVDPYKCGGTAVKAAIVAAKEYTETKVTYDSIINVTPSRRSQITKYEIMLNQWFEGDSFSLTYEVVVRGQKPNCKVVRVELIGQE